MTCRARVPRHGQPVAPKRELPPVERKLNLKPPTEIGDGHYTDAFKQAQRGRKLAKRLASVPERVGRPAPQAAKVPVRAGGPLFW